MSESKEYYIINMQAGYVGNSVVFWNGRNGYTCKINPDKMLFTKKEAERIEKNRLTDKKIHKDVVEKVMMPQVDIQDLRKVIEI